MQIEVEKCFLLDWTKQIVKLNAEWVSVPNTNKAYVETWYPVTIYHIGSRNPKVVWQEEFGRN